MKPENKETHDKKVKEVLATLKGLKLKEANKALLESIKKLEETIY